MRYMLDTNILIHLIKKKPPSVAERIDALAEDTILCMSLFTFAELLKGAERSTRKDAVLRRYMLDFVQLFAPHITTDQLEKTRHARSQADIDRLFLEAELPVRGGCSDRMTDAA